MSSFFPATAVPPRAFSLGLVLAMVSMASTLFCNRQIAAIFSFEGETA
jgi:hypothetical protein